jgi:hypothetical protein
MNDHEAKNTFCRIVAQIVRRIERKETRPQTDQCQSKASSPPKQNS